MADPDPIAQAYALFNRLRDARDHRCDYRHTELEAFRLAVQSLPRPAGADRPRKRKGRVAPAESFLPQSATE